MNEKLNFLKNIKHIKDIDSNIELNMKKIMHMIHIRVKQNIQMYMINMEMVMLDFLKDIKKPHMVLTQKHKEILF